LCDNAKEVLNDKVVQEFNLTSSKLLGMNNLHLFTSKCNIKKYANVAEIIKEWSYVRIEKYQARKENQLMVMENEYLVLSAKIRFIIEVIEGTITIMNKKLKEVEEQLEAKEYYKFEDSYTYLLRMPISQLTTEKKEELELDVSNLKTEIENLKQTSIMTIWENELLTLLDEWNKHKNEILEDYENDSKGEIKKQVKRKK
jgi:DNA topoisomerase-2